MSAPRLRWTRAALAGGLPAALTLVFAGAAGAQSAVDQVVDPWDLVLNENDPSSTSRTVTVKLDAQPSATVTISVERSSFEGPTVAVSPSALTFTRTNWNTAQTLTFTAASDADNLDALTLVELAPDSHAVAVSARVSAAVHDDEATLVTSAGAGAGAETPPEVSDTESLYQGFTTGSDARGYSLRSVSAVLRTSNTNENMVNLKLWPEDGSNAGQPDLDATAIDLGTLDVDALELRRPEEWQVNQLYWAFASAPEAPVELEPNTTYFVGFAITSTDSGAWVQPSCSGRTGSLGLAGWSVAGQSLEYDGTTFTQRCRMKIRVRGSPLGPAVELTPSALSVTEGDAGRFEVELAEAPSSTVTVAVASEDTAAATVSPSSLTFSTSTWNTAQTVTVTGVHDTDEDDETVRVALFGAGVLSGDVPVTVLDDEGVGYVFRPPALDIDEGSAGMYTVALGAQPSATVTVAVASGDAAAATVSPASLTFSTSTWNTAQTVTVTAVGDDDAVDESVAISHTASGSDTDYTDLGAVTLTAAVDDDDWLRVDLVQARLPLPEDGSLVIACTQLRNPGGSPHFLPSGQQARVVFATRERSAGAVTKQARGGGVDYFDLRDVIRIGPSPTECRAVFVSNDSLLEHEESFDVVLEWDGAAPRLPDREVRLGTSAEIAIQDDDTGTLDFDAALYEVTEGETVDIVPSLTAQIANPLPMTVALGAALDGEAELVVTDSATQTLVNAREMNVVLPALANGAQSAIRVRALTDGVFESDEDGALTVTIAPTDLPTGLTFGPNLTANVVVRVLQPPNSAPSGRPSVSGGATLGQTLRAGKGSVSDADGLPANDSDLSWQWVRQNDAAGTGEVDIASATSAAYTLAAADQGKWVAVKMSYRDGGGSDEVVKSAALGPVASARLDVWPESPTVDEGGRSALEVALRTEPSASVTVSVTSGDTAAATVSPSSLTFTTSNWDRARTVTVAGVQDNDSTDDDAEVTFAASGGDYAGVSRTLTVAVEDDDVAGLVLTPTAVRAREGGTGAWTARLTVPPTATVTVSVTSGDTGAATVSPSSLTFTDSTWQTARTVTVTAVEDSDLDHEEATVTLAASGGNYGAVSETVTVAIEDDDLLSWGATDLPFLVVDEGRPLEREVTLVSQPSSPVSVTVDPGDAALDVSPPALAFTTAAWNTAQTFTFTAADDDDDADFERTMTFEGAGVTQSRTVRVQDDEATLVSNHAEGQAASAPPGRNHPAAYHRDGRRGYQGFTTGAHARGYTLRGASLALRASGTADVIVKLVPATTGGEPDLTAAAVTLGTIPAAEQVSGRTGLHDLSFSALRLDADTKYFIGISNPAAGADQASRFTCADGGGEFGMSGWSLADEAVQDENGTLRTRNCVLMMRLRGGEWRPPAPPPPPPSRPEISLASASALESAGAVVFVARLSRAGNFPVTVDYATSDGAGANGAVAGSDYTATAGTLTFPAGSTAREIQVPVLDDGLHEEAETFALTLERLVNATFAGGASVLRATGTIRDDDELPSPEPPPEISLASAEASESAGAMVFGVRLSRSSGSMVTVEYATSDGAGSGGAKAGSDYTATEGTLTFRAGSTAGQIRVPVLDDGRHEEAETFVLTLGRPVNATFAGGVSVLRARGTIRDDDGGSPTAAFEVAGATCGEDDERPGVVCRSLTGVPVRFVDESTGRVATRLWDFGDGVTSRSGAPSHSWSSPGFYEVTLSVSDGTTTSTASRTFQIEASEPEGTCVWDATTACLQDSRYAVTVEWRTADGAAGAGVVVPRGTNDSALFTFFDRENWEVLIKVLDGCAFNSHVWVFGASTTDLGYSILVTDTVTGSVKEYRNEPGRPAPAITDVAAFTEGVCEAPE